MTYDEDLQEQKKTSYSFIYEILTMFVLKKNCYAYEMFPMKITFSFLFSFFFIRKIYHLAQFLYLRNHWKIFLPFFFCPIIFTFLCTTICYFTRINNFLYENCIVFFCVVSSLLFFFQYCSTLLSCLLQFVIPVFFCLCFFCFFFFYISIVIVLCFLFSFLFILFYRINNWIW